MDASKPPCYRALHEFALKNGIVYNELWQAISDAFAEGLTDACRRVALRECWIAAGGFPHAFDELQGDPTASVLALIGQNRVLAGTVPNPLKVLDGQIRHAPQSGPWG